MLFYRSYNRIDPEILCNSFSCLVMVFLCVNIVPHCLHLKSRSLWLGSDCCKNFCFSAVPTQSMTFFLVLRLIYCHKTVFFRGALWCWLGNNRLLPRFAAVSNAIPVFFLINFWQLNSPLPMDHCRFPTHLHGIRNFLQGHSHGSRTPEQLHCRHYVHSAKLAPVVFSSSSGVFSSGIGRQVCVGPFEKSHRGRSNNSSWARPGSGFARAVGSSPAGLWWVI